MHAVTAMSGGGPAYVFLLIETLAAAGARLGLPAELAMRLSRATVIGSGELAAQASASASQLRQDVTSPGGTTQAALAVLMADDGVQPLFDRALDAAVRRSRELG
jgi:pyrroline-5-carboxylate reductase